MQDKFKSYLENEFRKIAPTRASKDYRIELYNQLVDYSQELRLKGITNDEMVFDLAIKSLGDMDENLDNFENELKAKKVEKAKRLASLIVIPSVLGLGLILMIAFGLFLKPGNQSGFRFSWIFMIFGVFATITALSMIHMIGSTSAKKALILRGEIFTITTLWLVFLSLSLKVIEIATSPLENPITIKGWWLGFVAIPAAIAIADLVIALATNEKGKWVNFSINLVVLMSIIYVLIGLILGPVFRITNKFWAYGWLLIIAGILGGSLAVFISKQSKSKKILKETGKPDDIDDKYYTEW